MEGFKQPYLSHQVYTCQKAKAIRVWNQKLGLKKILSSPICVEFSVQYIHRYQHYGRGLKN